MKANGMVGKEDFMTGMEAVGIGTAGSFEQHHRSVAESVFCSVNANR